MVVLAHNSAGPKEDILAYKDQRFGVLCDDSSYLEELKNVSKALFGNKKTEFSSRYSKQQLLQNMEKGRQRMKQTFSN